MTASHRKTLSLILKVSDRPYLGLVGAHAGLLVDLTAAVPHQHLVGDVARKRTAVLVEQFDAVGSRREEPVVRLDEHRGERQATVGIDRRLERIRRAR